MYLDPKNDLTFKRIFGDESHKNILMSFLNSILKLRNEHRIVDVHILNPDHVPRIQGLKETILDVHCKDEKGIQYIVEMQLARLEGFEKRVVYYSSQTYFSQIQQGDDYPRLNQVIFLGILGFSFLKTDDYISDHLILDQKTGEHALKDLRFCFVELPKFTKKEDDLVTIEDKWIYFLKNAENVQFIPKTMEQEKEIKEAFEILERYNWTNEELKLYDKLGIYRRDEIGRIEWAMKDGIRQGIEQGIQQGREEGAHQQKIHTAKKLLQKAMDVETIMEITGLTREEIQTITIN